MPKIAGCGNRGLNGDRERRWFGMQEIDVDPDVLDHQMWMLKAAKIEADPQLLAIPLRNMERWIARGIDGQEMLGRWRRLILAAQESQEGMDALLAVLRADDEGARHIKSYSPFPGVLTTEEVDQFQCAYRH